MSLSHSPPSETAKAEAQEASPAIVNGLLSIFERGVSPKTLKILNWVFACMLLSLLFFIISSHLMGWANIHSYIMFGLGVGLVLSFKWFMSMMVGIEPTYVRDSTQPPSSASTVIPEATAPVNANAPTAEADAKKNE